MIRGLYGLTCLKRPASRIIQVTAPLLQLFIQIGKNLSDQLNLFFYTVKFMTYFMNIRISNHVPCTDFIRPFDKNGFEKYFKDMYSERKFAEIEGFIAFDPDFKDQDWIKFELNSLQGKDLQNALTNTKSLKVVIPLSLRGKKKSFAF